MHTGTTEKSLSTCTLVSRALHIRATGRALVADLFFAFWCRAAVGPVDPAWTLFFRKLAEKKARRDRKAVVKQNWLIKHEPELVRPSDRQTAFICFSMPFRCRLANPRSCFE